MTSKKKEFMTPTTRKRELEKALEDMKKDPQTSPALIREYKQQIKEVNQEIREERKATRRLNKAVFKK